MRHRPPGEKHRHTIVGTEGGERGTRIVAFFGLVLFLSSYPPGISDKIKITLWNRQDPVQYSFRVSVSPSWEAMAL
jgi:hypothetical protein